MAKTNEQETESRQERRKREQMYPKEKAEVVKDLRNALYNLKVIVDYHGASRARSISITHIEEAVLMLEAEDRRGDNLLDRRPWEKEGGGG